MALKDLENTLANNYQQNTGSDFMSKFLQTGQVVSGFINPLANLGFGIGNSLYQSYLNNKQMEREDNAVSRRMADLSANGINPLMAVTGNVSGASSSSGSIAPTPQISQDFNNMVKDYEAQKLARLNYNNSLVALQIQNMELNHKKDMLEQTKKEWNDTWYKRHAEENQYKLNALGVSGFDSLSHTPSNIEQALMSIARALGGQLANNITEGTYKHVSTDDTQGTIYPTLPHRPSDSEIDWSQSKKEFFSSWSTYTDNQLLTFKGNLKSQGVDYTYDKNKRRLTVSHNGQNSVIYNNISANYKDIIEYLCYYAFAHKIDPKVKK